MFERLVVVVIAAIVGAACGSSSAVSTAPSPQKCGVSVSAPGGTFDQKGGGETLALTTAAECTWTASSQVSWITQLNPASGQGNAQIQFEVAANPDASVRQGEIVFNDQHVQIRQAGTPCTFQIAPTTLTIPAAAGGGTITVIAPNGCTWSAAPTVSWLSIASSASGSGNGTITLHADANTGGGRSGSVTVAGQTVAVAQNGTTPAPLPAPAPGMPCTYAIDAPVQQIGASGGALMSSVITGAGCSWTAVSSVPWVTITSGATGSGTGAVTFTVAANPGSPRSGALTIAGQTLTVEQVVGCIASLNPTTQTVPFGGASGAPVAVTIPAGCAWTSTSGAPWLTIIDGASGVGNGTLIFSAAANAGAPRSGTITIAGQPFIVNQGNNCTATLNPASQSLPLGGGAGTPIAVTIQAGCGWTAVSGAPWLTITGGASGTGNGTVTFSAGANSGAARSGAIAIAGQSFTVDQAASCTASVNPTSQSIPVGGGAGAPITVTSTAGCGWTAVSNAQWLTISSGATGTGNGTVNFTAAANSGAARSGTLTIAGQTFTVDQAASCTASLNPTSQSIPVGGGAGAPIAVTSTAGCGWTAVSNAQWLTISSGATGTGNGTVNFTAAANSGGARSGTLTIAGQTFTANQAANCSLSLNPTSQSVPASGGAGAPIAVTNPSGCGWTAASDVPWLTITAGTSGTANGTVKFTADANVGPARSGTLTIAGLKFTANQADGCAGLLNPASQAFPTSGGAGGPIAVTIGAGCTWTGTSNVSWITINSGANGSSNGTVTFTVAANNGPARSGTLTIAGQTFTATQATACNGSLNPTSQNVGKDGVNNSTVNLTIGSACDWTAVNQVSWITIQSGGSGRGNGQVKFSVDKLPGNQDSRTGTIVIAGLTFTVSESR
jgi:hypothetical protein